MSGPRSRWFKRQVKHARAPADSCELRARLPSRAAPRHVSQQCRRPPDPYTVRKSYPRPLFSAITRLLTSSPHGVIFDRVRGCPQLLCRELRADEYHRPSRAAGGAKTAGHRLRVQARPSRRRQHVAEHVSSIHTAVRRRQGACRRRRRRRRADGNPRLAEARQRRRRRRAHPARAWEPPAASARRISKSPHPRLTSLCEPLRRAGPAIGRARAYQHARR